MYFFVIILVMPMFYLDALAYITERHSVVGDAYYETG